MCAVCGGRGELPVVGTYGPTVSPENLQTRPCYSCTTR